MSHAGPRAPLCYSAAVNPRAKAILMSVRLLSFAVFATSCVALSGCATTHAYTLANGKSAYEAQCTLWFQCVHQAKEMCPHGYDLVKGPMRRQPALPNGTRTAGPSRLDFVCR